MHQVSLLVVCCVDYLQYIAASWASCIDLYNSRECAEPEEPLTRQTCIQQRTQHDVATVGQSPC